MRSIVFEALFADSSLSQTKTKTNYLFKLFFCVTVVEGVTGDFMCTTAHFVGDGFVSSLMHFTQLHHFWRLEKKYTLH